jgi:hypothetical protein
LGIPSKSDVVYTLSTADTSSRTADTSDDVDLSHLDAPISPRSRLESTASSIFFPGGWFSKMPEGRASMDVAQGEFIPSSPTSPSMAQSEEKKGKWCVVM